MSDKTYTVYRDTEGWIEYEVEAGGPELAKDKVQDRALGMEVEGVKVKEDHLGHETVDIVVKSEKEGG